jgi:hypothetical protein
MRTPNYNIKGTKYDRRLYAFVGRAPKIETRNYEGMDLLLTAIDFSQLVHPTSTGYRYCAKVFNFGRKDSSVQAIQYSGMCPDVFLSDGNRDWLSTADGEELLKFRPWFSNKPLYERVQRAFWNHGYALHSYHLDMRWILVVAGLEAMLNVEELDSGIQFRERVGKLATEFSIEFTESELRSAWTLRSKLSHAKSFLFGLDAVLAQSEHKPLYDKLELLLRLTIKRCFLDNEFANRFCDDNAVRANWPSTARRKK